MDSADFLEAIQSLAEFDSIEEARDTAEATLMVLGVGLSKSEAEDLATKLPEEHAAAVRNAVADAPSARETTEVKDRLPPEYRPIYRADGS